MSTIAYIMIALLIITVATLIATVLIIKKKKKEIATKEIDYRAFFILGISFLPMGIIFSSTISPAFIGFIGMGACFMVIGLANKDKWKKKE